MSEKISLDSSDIPAFLKKTSFSFRVVPGYPVIYTEGGNKASDNT